MSLDGIWVFEVAGLYGWERLSTVFMEKGRYLGGSSSIYSQGKYVIKGKKVKIQLDVTQHGDLSVVFGIKSRHFSTVTTAKIKKKGQKIEGIVRMEGARSNVNTYHVRWIKQEKILALPSK
ncbi:MAG: hypothetical protein KZQ83_10215 [gamma proteobacterium symbiont of Taylorina sp.]|nr:hypothetical protein [gamma proteobacterium symbiont of Taylorina sp.]